MKTLIILYMILRPLTKLIDKYFIVHNHIEKMAVWAMASNKPKHTLCVLQKARAYLNKNMLYFTRSHYKQLHLFFNKTLVKGVRT